MFNAPHKLWLWPPSKMITGHHISIYNLISESTWIQCWLFCVNESNSSLFYITSTDTNSTGTLVWAIYFFFQYDACWHHCAKLNACHWCCRHEDWMFRDCTVVFFVKCESSILLNKFWETSSHHRKHLKLSIMLAVKSWSNFPSYHGYEKRIKQKTAPSVIIPSSIY